MVTFPRNEVHMLKKLVWAKYPLEFKQEVARMTKTKGSIAAL